MTSMSQHFSNPRFPAEKLCTDFRRERIVGENLDKHSAKRLIVENIRFQMGKLIQKPVEVPLKSSSIKKV